MVDRFALQNDGPDWRMGTCCTIKSLFLIQNVDAMKLSVYIYQCKNNLSLAAKAILVL